MNLILKNRRPVLRWFLAGWVLLAASTSFAQSFIDRGQSIFFPQGSGEAVQQYKNFPITWWNFIVLDIQNNPQGLDAANSLCESILQKNSDLLSKISCHEDIARFLPILKDWARDVPLRQDRPSDGQMREFLNQALAKASVAMDRNLIGHLRQDPFGSDSELKRLGESALRFDLERKNGFFEADGRIVIPIQFNFPPEKDDLTRLFHSRIQGAPDFTLIGPHASTLENKNEIIRDLNSVSRAGTVVLFLFALSLILMKRARLLLIIPPILISVGLATLVTVAVYGSIHGLVLAFGVGLVGISYDYGSHSALNPENPSVWEANWFGYLTTIAVLVILMFSQIPLLRQMMFFSTVGLTAAFFSLLALHRFFPNYSRAEPLSVVPKAKTWKWVLVAFIQLGLLASWKVDLQFDMASFDFQSPKQRETATWLFSRFKSGIPLFEIVTEQNALDQSNERLTWAKKEGIRAQNAALYLPPIQTQEAHLQTWRRSHCAGFLESLPPEQTRFFEPALANLRCESLQPRGLSGLPSYIRDFNWENQWITLWLPKNLSESNRIQAAYPNAASLKSLVNLLPQTLTREIKWMAPLSFIVVGLLLFFYFKNLRLALIALIPFMTGLGLLSWFHVLTGTPFSFISLLALVMLYGMSIDYGIFSADTCRYTQMREVKGVWTALFMASLTTVAGFIPLDFCNHPVLIDLGRTLTLGMVGSVLGTYWGVPAAFKKEIRAS